jgi:GT2 family glycosyltransferase
MGQCYLRGGITNGAVSIFLAGKRRSPLMQPKPLISIIIVYWNSAKYLPGCLDRISQQTFRDFEIIIIDNGSLDGGTTGLEQIYPQLNLRLERFDSNLGFAVANNLGARLACGKWLVLLNADAFPNSDWLEKLIAATRAYPNIASFSSRQLQANHPNFLDGAGDAYHVSGFAWRIDLGYPADRYGLEVAELFSPCAAAAMYLREAFIEAGGFDEDFFSYYEDVDLGFRLQLKNYRCMYVPQAIVHHVGSATFGVRSDFAFYYSHRNLVWTFVQNMPSTLLWRYLPAHIAANLIYVLYYTLRGRGKVLWKAKWDALHGLPKALEKRREIQKNKRVSDTDLLGIMECGWLKPYLLGFHLRRALAGSTKEK